MCTKFYKKNVFLSGLFLNIISSLLVLILIILCGVQFKYINNNFTKLNPYQNLCDFELSFCIIYIFCCILGFIVFIKSLECKTMQIIYLIYAILAWILSIIACVFSFLSVPDKYKKNSITNCDSINLKGILHNFNKLEPIFYEIDNILTSNECPSSSNSFQNYKECPEEIRDNAIKNGLSNITNNDIKDNFKTKEFISYWSDVEKKFDCVGFCNISYYSNETKYDLGCLYPFSNWLNKMILSFSSILIVNIVISVICIYIGFAIYFDKVFEGSNYPDVSGNYNEKGIISNSEHKQIGIIAGKQFKEKPLDTKVTH